MREWAFEVLDQDLQLGSIERDAGRERFADQLVSNIHVRHDNFNAARS